jgi:hypothetical protein
VETTIRINFYKLKKAIRSSSRNGSDLEKKNCDLDCTFIKYDWYNPDRFDGHPEDLLRAFA